ncbi:MAG: hypothetical protein GC186_16535 [Rhodobacteraceae bacterium]|nr:hypothetical protein [Paracoccaceae bacterium]
MPLLVEIVPYVFWGGMGLLGLNAIKSTDQAVTDAGTAATKAQGLGKLALIGGGLYVAYRVMQKRGLAK